MTVQPDRDSGDPIRQGNTLIGERIHQLMWRNGLTQKQLGNLLGVDQGSVSKRLRGKTDWAATEVAVAAAWLAVPITDLIPEVEICPPDPSDGGAGAPSRTRTCDLRIIRPISAA
jgi:transcriptional regulator with XRE-family HTH domain